MGDAQAANRRFGRGELGGTWKNLFAEVWLDLPDQTGGYPDFFVDLAGELQFHLRVPLTSNELADRTADSVEAEAYVGSIGPEDLLDEQHIVKLVEASSQVILENAGKASFESYYADLSDFLRRHNSRYRLSRPFSIVLSIEGMHTIAMEELQRQIARDKHAAQSWSNLQVAIDDLQYGFDDARIKTAIGKYFNFLEALASGLEGVDASTLGAQSVQMSTWPHKAVKNAVAALYGFASDYPGIRHGSRAEVSRQLDVRDVFSMMSTLSGLTPYFFDSSAALSQNGWLIGRVEISADRSA
ncbi:hypothetical protein HQQ80_20905 [Microbacteriaceae bacterium VKM Ac-2855]|nr:hypothetical protein [Microbacteriaceae bacterium VKM Ac-2855]